MNRTANVCVVGSLNVDHTLMAARLPVPGETLMARGAFTSFGGKGANQAVAAARAGARVALIGCVGNDDNGARYRIHLSAEGIDVCGVSTAPQETPTGSAFIVVDDSGENFILVNAGANEALSPAQIDQFASLIRGSHILLMQLECPLPAILHAAHVARAAGVKVVINPSPWSAAFLTAGIPADILVTNEREAALLTGHDPVTLLEHPCDALNAAQCPVLIVTRGKAPTLVLSATEGCLALAPPAVTPVDTVGAGDTFAGAFTVAIAEGRSLRDAVAFANAAAALATLQSGAQAAIPSRAQILDFASAGGAGAAPFPLKGV